MLKKIVVLAVAGAALVAPAPAAFADVPDYGCQLVATQTGTLTGTLYEGFAVGYVVHSDTGPVSITCSVLVNGTEVAATPTASGTAATVGAGRITYWAEETDVVTLRAYATTFHGGYTRDYEAIHSTVPPQPVEDFLAPLRDVLLEFYVNPVLCPLLAALAGSYELVTIGPDGDVYLPATRLHDCPPYGNGSASPSPLVVRLVTAGFAHIT